MDKDHKLITKNILKIQPTLSLQDFEGFFLYLITTTTTTLPHPYQMP